MTICDNRCSTTLSLNRNHTKILISSKDKSLCMLHLVFQHIKWLISHHGHIILGQFTISLQIWTTTYHNQFLIRHLIKGFDDGINLLISH